MFSVLWVALGGSFETDPLISIDKVMAELMVSILFAVLKLVAMNLFISLMSYLFGRAYNKARATALLQSANYILTTERNLGIQKTKYFRKKMRIECNPLVCKAQFKQPNICEICWLKKCSNDPTFHPTFHPTIRFRF